MSRNEADACDIVQNGCQISSGTMTEQSYSRTKAAYAQTWVYRINAERMLPASETAKSSLV